MYISFIITSINKAKYILRKNVLNINGYLGSRMANAEIKKGKMLYLNALFLTFLKVAKITFFTNFFNVHLYLKKYQNWL